MSPSSPTPLERSDVPYRDHGIPFGEAMRVWARIAALSFGGPAGQIAVMHRILVDEKKWIGEERFLHALTTIACCSPVPRRSSSPPISVGCSTRLRAAGRGELCSSCPASSLFWA